MNHVAGLSLALVISHAANAAEPTAPLPSAPPPRVATVPEAKPASATDRPASTPPAGRLDLRVGKIRDLLTRREMAALLGAPDWEKDAIVVEGQRELVPMKFEEPVPGGLMALWWAVKTPTQSWRILLPVPNAPAAGPTVDKVPPREFRWGP